MALGRINLGVTMYFVNHKGAIVEELHILGKTKSGLKIVSNPGNGWTAIAAKGERLRQDRDGNYVVSKSKR
jgi:hypothetical protein